MALRIRDALLVGGRRAISRNGAVFVIAFVAVSAFNQLLVAGAMTSTLQFAPGALPPASSAADSSLGQQLSPFVRAQAAFVTALAGSLLTQPIRIVAIRTMVAGVTDHVPDAAMFHGLGWAIVRTLVVGAVATVAVFCALVVPPAAVAFVASGLPLLASVVLILAALAVGVIAAAYLGLGLVFASQEVVVRDETVVGALARSWSLASGNRVRLLALWIVLAVPQAVLSGIGGGLDAVAPLASTAFTVVTVSAVTVVAIAVFARAYGQLAGPDVVESPAWRS